MTPTFKTQPKAATNVERVKEREKSGKQTEKRKNILLSTNTQVF